MLACLPVYAQVCRLSVAGLNRNRRVRHVQRDRLGPHVD